MPDKQSDTRKAAKPSIFPSPREEQRMRNALARRKLEELREHELLRSQLTDVWDEVGKE